MGSEFLNLHPFVRTLAADKARGVILGGALGDACGLYTEFASSARVRRMYPEGIEFGTTPLHGDRHRDAFSPGSWTDDTDHALLLVLSFLHHYGEHREGPSASTLGLDFAARLQCWCHQGLLALSTIRLGLGQTIGYVAFHPDFLGGPKRLADKIWAGSPDDRKPASNGSLMRAHPLGVIAATYRTDDDAHELAAELSRTTHGEPRCTLASCALVGTLRGIIRGDIADEDALDRGLDRAEEYVKARPELCQSDAGTEDGEEKGADPDPDPHRWLKLDEFRSYTSRDATFASLRLDEATGIGYVYKCLGAGILTLRLAMRTVPAAPETFEERMLALVMEGGDADTNGSVAGALLGAWLGESRLPPAWIRKLRHREWLHNKTVRFVAAAGIQDRAGLEAWEKEPRDADADIHGGRQPLSKMELAEREALHFQRMNSQLRASIEAEEQSPPATSKIRRLLRRGGERATK